MDEMKLLEDFCAREPEPHPRRLAQARSELIQAINQAGLPGSQRTWGRRARTLSRARQRHLATGWRAGRSWPAWVAPLAAAAAVVVAVTVPLAIFRGDAPAAAPAGGAAGGPDGAPPFYMAAPFDGRYAVIDATATGKTLVTIKPPRGTRSIGPVGAAADDLTFVLGAGSSAKSGYTEFFLARFHPRTRSVSLTRLPIHFKAPGNTAVALAVSPDASKMAAIEWELGVKRSVLAVTTYVLATGHSRTWTRKIPGLSPGIGAQVWSANARELEVVWQQSLGRSVPLFAGRLDTAAPGSRLPAPVKLPVPTRLTQTLEYIYVPPDGDVFIAAGAYRPAWTLTDFSARTGKLTRVLGPTRRTKITPSVEWASNTGHVLIIAGKDGGLGVLRNRRYLPLPMPGILRNPLSSAVW